MVIYNQYQVFKPFRREKEKLEHNGKESFGFSEHFAQKKTSFSHFKMKFTDVSLECKSL